MEKFVVVTASADGIELEVEVEEGVEESVERLRVADLSATTYS